jgi:hypothetical protein
MTHSKAINVLASLTLLLLVTGCASPQTIYKTSTVYLHPPAFLLSECPVPEYTGTEWVHVAEYAGKLQSMLSLCNDDKGLLREWVTEHE